MDKEVIDFFNSHINIEHNKDVLPIPNEFISVTSDDNTKKFFKWIRHESCCDSLKFNITADVSQIKDELKNLEFLGIPHRDHTGWRSITLYGYSSIMTNSYEHYKSLGIINDSDKTKWTDICEFFPKTVDWLKKYCPLKEYSRIRIMILDPGGSSTPHKDYYDGQALCGPINIAVVNPPGAEFVLENGGLVPWSEGDFRSVNLGKVHCIRNTGTEPRIHIIITPSKNDWDIDAMNMACNTFINFQKERHESGRN